MVGVLVSWLSEERSCIAHTVVTAIHVCLTPEYQKKGEASGVVEPFNREKVISGVRKACKGRPVTEAQLAKLGQRVEESIRVSGYAEVPTDDVGIAILGPLSELDAVAYLRFASVYRHYNSADDFIAEIEVMRRTSLPKGEDESDSVPAEP